MLLRRGQAVITPASYSEGPGSKHKTEDPLSSLFSWLSPLPLDTFRDSILKLVKTPSFHIISNSVLAYFPKIKVAYQIASQSVPPPPH
jgi:hypothetical protein